MMESVSEAFAVSIFETLPLLCEEMTLNNFVIDEYCSLGNSTFATPREKSWRISYFLFWNTNVLVEYVRQSRRTRRDLEKKSYPYKLRTAF